MLLSQDDESSDGLGDQRSRATGDHMALQGGLELVPARPLPPVPSA